MPNRSTVEWKRWLLGRYGSPLVAMLEAAARSPADLARELEMFRRGEDGAPLLGADGKPLLQPDALVRCYDRQMSALQACLPYLHQKLPQAIEVTDKPRGTLVINLGAYGEGAGELSALPIVRGEGNQQVADTCSDAEVVQSDAQQVGREPNPLAD